MIAETWIHKFLNNLQYYRLDPVQKNEVGEADVMWLKSAVWMILQGSMGGYEIAK